MTGSKLCAVELGLEGLFFFFKKINHFGFFLKYFLLLFLNQLTK